MFGLGMQELLVIGVVAVLLFGKNLPDVAKKLGKSYGEFRKGLTDIQSQIASADLYGNRSSTSSSYKSESNYDDDYDDYEEATAPKFEPPPAEPQEQTAS